MKTTTPLIVALVAAALGAAASPGYAQEATPDRWIAEAKATKSVAEVKAELAQARRDGTARSVTPDYDFAARSASTKLRVQVRADLYQARETGELDALNAEATNFASVRRMSMYAQQ